MADEITLTNVVSTMTVRQAYEAFGDELNRRENEILAMRRLRSACEVANVAEQDLQKVKDEIAQGIVDLRGIDEQLVAKEKIVSDKLVTLEQSYRDKKQNLDDKIKAERDAASSSFESFKASNEADKLSLSKACLALDAQRNQLQAEISSLTKTRDDLRDEIRSSAKRTAEIVSAVSG